MPKFNWKVDEHIEATDTRLLLTGAVSVIEEYALSKTAFNLDRDIVAIRAITQAAAKLLDVLVAEEKPDGTEGVSEGTRKTEDDAKGVQ